MHYSVLLKEVVDTLAPKNGEVICDGTLGGAGHSVALTKDLTSGTFVGLDMDQDALDRAKEKLEKSPLDIRLIKGNFRNLRTLLNEEKIEKLDVALFDLGWSSFQLSVGRGFSFRADEPLLMTYRRAGDIGSELTAYEVVNSWSEEDIANALFTYGGERASRKIAHAIVAARTIKPIQTSLELAQVVEAVLPRGKTHAATKTFQALRIIVNDEIGVLEDVLEQIPGCMESGGRLGIITFHSLEDAVVKKAFRLYHRNGLLKGHPERIFPSREEARAHPSARSAVLRAVTFA